MVSRRTALRACGAALLGLAGCTSPNGSDGTSTTARTPTPTAVPTDGSGGTDERLTGQSPTGDPGDITVEGAAPAWTRSLDAPVRGDPAYVDGRVVVAAGERVYALDAATGETAWTLDPPATPDDDHERLDATLRVHEGTLYALVGVSFGTGGTGFHLFALDPDGSERWRYGSDLTRFLDLAALGRGTALLPTYDDARGSTGEVALVVDLADGTERWRADTGDGRGGALGPGLTVVESYGAADGFALASGERRFRFAPDDARIHDSAVGGGSAYVAASVDGDDGDVVSFDAESGESAWTGVGFAATSLRYRDDLYAGGDSVARLGADGSERWSSDVGGPVADVPFDDGVLYTNAGSGIVALARDDGAELWSTDAPEGALPRLRGGDAVVSHAGRLRRVFVHDAADGTERWRAHVPGGYTHGPAAGDGAAYLLTSDATVARVPLSP